ncbi:MAG: hypothetical protein U9N76_03285 [Candidatus Marinimicrobia bacterium]|nr:hypothetical protein [Candidatus Neomarinimicrobiota bacterium]
MDKENTVNEPRASYNTVANIPKENLGVIFHQYFIEEINKYKKKQDDELFLDPSMRDIYERLIKLEEELKNQRILMEARFEASDKRFGDLQKSMNTRFNEMQHYMDKRFDANDKRFNDLQKNMDKRFESMQKNMDSRFESMQKNMDSRFEDMNTRFNQLTWMIGGSFGLLTIFMAVLKIFS